MEQSGRIVSRNQGLRGLATLLCRIWARTRFTWHRDMSIVDDCIIDVRGTHACRGYGEAGGETHLFHPGQEDAQAI